MSRWLLKGKAAATEATSCYATKLVPTENYWLGQTGMGIRSVTPHNGGSKS